MSGFGPPANLSDTVRGHSEVSELAPEFVKSAFHTADRDHTGDIDIWEFVTWCLKSWSVRRASSCHCRQT